MIPQRNLSLLSNRLARHGGRRIPEAVLERDYCLAWFLVGLSRSPLHARIVFKGGTALKRCYFGDYRFSEDLDFTLTEDLSFDELRAELEPIFVDVQRSSAIAFRFEREDRQRHTNCYTFYLSYEGPLPARVLSQVKVDMTIRERLVLPIAQQPVIRGYDEYEDLPEGAIVRVYSLEEIAVEKIVALSDRARNEPRDLFDIWHLTTQGHIVLDHLTAEIASKLEFRGRAKIAIGDEFQKKEARLKMLWGTRLSAQMSELPEFDRVFRSVQRSLRQAGLAG